MSEQAHFDYFDRPALRSGARIETFTSSTRSATPSDRPALRSGARIETDGERGGRGDLKIKANSELIQAAQGAAKRPEAARKMGLPVEDEVALQKRIDDLRAQNAALANPDAAIFERLRQEAGLPPREPAAVEEPPAKPGEEGQTDMFGGEAPSLPPTALDAHNGSALLPAAEKLELPKQNERFSPASNGGSDLGRIKEDVAKTAGLEAAPVRMEVGSLDHFSPQRLKEIEAEGYDSPTALAEYVVNNFTHIYQGKKQTFVLAKRNGKVKISWIEIVPDESGKYYRVNSAAITRPDFLQNKKPLWERAQSSQLPEESPSAITGQSGTTLVEPNRGEVKTAPSSSDSAGGNATTDRIISALEKAKIHKPGMTSAGTPLTLAWDGAMDVAILGIKAGRAAAEIIADAIKHFKGAFPEATPAHVDRLGASLKAMLDSRVALETNAANGPAPEGEGVGIRNASIAQQREAIGSERGTD